MKILISRLLSFILFLFLLMGVRFQVSVFGFQRTEARRQPATSPSVVSSWLKNSGSNDSLLQTQGLSLSKAAESKTHGENWKMKHPCCPLVSVLRHLIASDSAKLKSFPIKPVVSAAGGWAEPLAQTWNAKMWC